MQIKKSSLEALFNLAKGTEGALSLVEARIRDGFIKPLTELTQTYFDQREVIYKHFCNKNDDGTPNLLEGYKYQFSKEVLEELNKELATLGDELVEVNFTDNPQQIKQILEKSEYKLKVLESELIDEILKSI